MTGDLVRIEDREAGFITGLPQISIGQTEPRRRFSGAFVDRIGE